MEEEIEISVTIKRMTTKAWLVVIHRKKGDFETWLPTSQVKWTDCLAEGDNGTMRITRWIAEEKGLVKRAKKENDEAPEVPGARDPRRNRKRRY